MGVIGVASIGEPRVENVRGVCCVAVVWQQESDVRLGREKNPCEEVMMHGVWCVVQ